MSTGNPFEDKLDDFLNTHARSAANWRYTTADTGVEAIAHTVTSLFLNGLLEPAGADIPELDERMTVVLVRAYLAGWDHASDHVRDTGRGELADQLNLLV